MRAKDFLQQVFNINNFIKIDEDEICKLNTWLYSPNGINYGDRIQSNVSSDRLSILIDKIDKAKLDLEKDIETYLRVKEEVKDVINKVEDEKVRVVLIKRYINLKKWSEIADEMYYTQEWIFRLHRIGLIEVEKILNNSF